MVAKATLQNLGTIVREKRGDRALRAVAADIGTSAPLCLGSSPARCQTFRPSVSPNPPKEGVGSVS